MKSSKLIIIFQIILYNDFKFIVILERNILNERIEILKKIMVLKSISNLLIFFLLLLLPSTVLAQEEEQSAGNKIYTGNDNSITGSVERDLYCYDRISDIDGANIGRSAIIAAQNVNIKNSKIGDSLRSASQTLNISQTTIDNNITAAAQSIYIDDGTTSNAIYGAAGELEMHGTTNYLLFYGDSVTISGNIKGDAEITASNIIVKSGAVIDGNLKVLSENQPTIEDGATIGNVSVNLKEKEPEATIGEKIMGEITSIGYWIVATVIIGMLMIMFANQAISQASTLVRERPLAFFLSGFLGLILIPFVLLILFIPLVTIPASAVLLVLYGVCLGISVPFTSLTLSRLFLPNMNKWLSGLIFLAVGALLSRIKFVGLLILLICHIFILGYAILALYRNMKESFRSNTSEKFD